MSTPDSASMLAVATAYRTAGRCVLPIAPGCKAPSVLDVTTGEIIKIRWHHFQGQMPSIRHLRTWFPPNRTMGIGIACGPVSGQIIEGTPHALEVLDIDDEDTLNAFIEAANYQGLHTVMQRLLYQRTPGGAGHFAYLCATWEGNLQLARRHTSVDGDGNPTLKGAAFVTLIETRGAGGQAIVAPTPPGIHPEHPERGYTLVRGTWEALPIITTEERQTLFALARSFNSYIEPKRVERERGVRHPSGNRPGDYLNQIADVAWWTALLQRHGWTLVHQRGDIYYWQRPGKEGKAWSATLGACGRLFYVFSSNAAPFAVDTAYTAFTALTLLDYQGDFARASQAIRQTMMAQEATAKRPPDLLPSKEPVSSYDTPPDLSWAERLDSLLEVIDPEEWYSHTALTVLGHYRHTPHVWGRIKARALKRRIYTKDLEAAVDSWGQLHDSSTTRRSMRHLLSEQPWREQLIVTGQGDPKENVHNIGVFLACHPTWQNKLWWDVGRGQAMVGDEPLTQDLVTQISQWLGKEERLPVKALKLVEQCIITECHKKPRDLLREYLEKLPAWDGISRLDDWLVDIAGVDKNRYGMAVSRIIPVSMVARVMEPGCLYRFVVILEGPEEYKKSTLVMALAGEEWYVPLLTGLESKESHMMLQGAWVAEMPELDSLSRTEETRLKAFISLKEDTYIPKYSNFRLITPRRTIFIGTTNEESYLKGQTGNTRFLPIRVTQVIDVHSFNALREQLLSEALQWYHAHTHDWWVFPAEALAQARVTREARRLVSIYEEPLREWLSTGRFLPQQQGVEDGRPYLPQPGVTTWREIARWFLKMDTPERWKDISLQKQIAASLKAIGWEQCVEWDEIAHKSRRLWREIRPRGDP